MIRLLQYFFYLTYHWNIRIAWYICKEEWKGEKKYGIQTTGADELKNLEQLGIDIDHATIYMPVSYGLMENCFEKIGQLSANPIQHLLDLGCGKGRALCMAPSFGITKLTGIDFSKDLCNSAIQNLGKIKQQYPIIDYKIINNDAFYFEIPTTVDLVFLFNPFDEIILKGVTANILESIQENPRKLWIIYVNPLHKETFLDAGFKEVFHEKKLRYLEASILVN